jgi:hypothetical protein
VEDRARELRRAHRPQQAAQARQRSRGADAFVEHLLPAPPKPGRHTRIEHLFEAGRKRVAR